MRNPGDVPLTEDEIERWRQKFRLLDSWKILYCEDENVPEGMMCHAGHIDIGVRHKRADIEPCPATVDPESYLLHEMLHIGVQVVAGCRDRGKRKEKEEILIQDICAIVKALGEDRDELVPIVRDRR